MRWCPDGQGGAAVHEDGGVACACGDQPDPFLFVRRLVHDDFPALFAQRPDEAVFFAGVVLVGFDDFELRCDAFGLAGHLVSDGSGFLVGWCDGHSDNVWGDGMVASAFSDGANDYSEVTEVAIEVSCRTFRRFAAEPSPDIDVVCALYLPVGLEHSARRYPPGVDLGLGGVVGCAGRPTFRSRWRQWRSRWQRELTISQRRVRGSDRPSIAGRCRHRRG